MRILGLRRCFVIRAEQWARAHQCIFSSLSKILSVKAQDTHGCRMSIIFLVPICLLLFFSQSLFLFQVFFRLYSKLCTIDRSSRLNLSLLLLSLFVIIRLCTLSVMSLSLSVCVCLYFLPFS